MTGFARGENAHLIPGFDGTRGDFAAKPAEVQIGSVYPLNGHAELLRRTCVLIQIDTF